MDKLFLQGYEAARKAGLSDDKIIADLANNPVYGPAIQKAKASGLSGGAIMSGLKSGQLEAMANPKLEERTFLEGMGRGGQDVFAGITSLIPGSLGDEYTQAAADRAKVYDKANQNIGFDGARVVGQVAGLAPLMLAAPAATAATGARVAGNAAIGAVSGFIPREESLGQRAMNAGIGLVAGATAPEVLRGGAGLVSKAIRYGKSKNTASITVAVDKALQEAEQAIAAQGAAAPQITEQVKTYLADLAAKQLRATGKVDEKALARAAQITRLNPELRPTLGQITRDPATWSAEQNLAKSGTEGGNQLTDRFVQQEAILRSEADKLVDGTGGQKLSNYEYGGKAGGFLRDKWKAMQEEVSAAYKAAEQQYGDVRVGMDGLVKGIADKAFTEGQETAAGRMANIALNRLKGYGLFDESGNLKEGASLSIQQLRDLRQTLSSIDSLTGATPDQAIAAKSNIIGAIDDAVGESEVGDVFKPARDAARARFGEFADRTMTRIKSDQVPDEKLFDLATGRNVDTARDFTRALTTGTPEQMATGDQILRDTQRKLMAQLLNKAQRGPDGEEMFRPANLRDALNPDLNGYEPEVLNTVLGPEQTGSLQNFSQVLDYLRAPTQFDSVNYSKSGALIAGLLDGGRGLTARLPGLGMLDAGPTAGLIGAAVNSASGSAKEAQKQALIKALTDANPAGLPGMNKAVLDEMLNTVMARVLLRNTRSGGSTASAANQ